ncbi:hypothetical protein E2562_000846 [Oryza meyeriana var. granulata]|uniref:Uncharacterized protein n=1 Tax=Oryza meyeriana var. granulata TaxID=110450 RepID=A0A6G1CXW3_9ORYZ|nr:hypothetical protein E2562_000846 [Oryza meyeriana var. granulata]
MCFKFLSSCFGGENDYGQTNRDPSYHRPLSMTPSGNSYQGDSTLPATAVPAATTDAYGAYCGRAAYQQQKPSYASYPPADESARPLAGGWNKKVDRHTYRQ